MTRILGYIVTIATTLLVLLLIWQFRISVVLFLLSLALAAALRPLISNITDKKFTKPFALGFVYAALILSIVLFVVLVGSPLVQDLEKVSDDMVTTYEGIKTDWPQQTSMFKQAIAEQLPPSADLLKALTSSEGQTARQGFLTATQNFFSLFGYLGIIIILSLYWSADQVRFERLGLSMFPAEHHARALHIWRSMEAGVGAFLRSELAQGILAGFFLLVGYVLMGVRYPVLLTLWAVVARLAPWFGILIALVPLIILGVGSGASAAAFLPAVYTLVVLIALKFLVEPRLIHGQRYNSLSIVLFVIAMAEIFGIIGVFLAPVAAVATQILFGELYPTFAHRWAQEPLKEAINLRRRLQKVQANARRSLSSEDAILLNRTNRLLQRVREYITNQ